MKYFFPHREMWTDCVYACACVRTYTSCVHTYILQAAFRCLPPVVSAPLLLCLVSITVISSGLEILELLYFQLLICWARNGRSHPNKHSRGENRWLDTFFIHTGGRLGYGCKQELGFLFCGDTFPPRQVPIRDCSVELQLRLHLLTML